MATPRSRTMFQRMRELYGEFVRNEARAPLLAERVPESLRAYIPYAELWGVADDLEREQLVERAPGGCPFVTQFFQSTHATDHGHHREEGYDRGKEPVDLGHIGRIYSEKSTSSGCA